MTTDEKYLQHNKNSRKSRELLNKLYDQILTLSQDELLQKLNEIKMYKQIGDNKRK